MNAFEEDLIERHFNGALKSEETAELGRLLVENPGVADRFARMLRLEATLGAAFKERGREELFTRMLENVQRNLPPPGRSERIKIAVKKRAAAVLAAWRPLTAAAAGAALLGGGGWLAFRASRVTNGVDAPEALARWTPKVVEGRAGFSTAGAVAAKQDAASVRRRLRGFFVPSVGVRSVPVSEALAALEAQWRSLPHRRGPESAAEVAFVIADGVRKLWADAAEEPRVTLEMTGVSFLTHLELLAAQAGLNVEFFADGVLFAADERLSAPDAAEVKTWTLPVAKRTVEALARSHQKRVPVKVKQLQTPAPEELPTSWLYQTKDGGVGRFDASGGLNMISGREPSAVNPIIGRIANWTDSGEESGELAGERLLAEGSGVHAPPDSNPDVSNTPPEVSMHSKFVEVAQVPDPAYGIDLNLAPEVVEFEGFINYGKPLQQGEEVLLTESKTAQPVFSTANGDTPPATPEDAMRTQIATHKAQAGRLRGLTGERLVDEVIAQGAEDRMETAGTPVDYNIDPANIGEVFDFDQLRRYGSTDAPELVMENLLSAHSGAGLAYNAETETLSLTGDLRALRAAQRAAGAAEECATAGAAVEVRFVEWEDAPPVLSEGGLELSRGAPRFLSPVQEISRAGVTAAPNGESVERNERGNTAMVRFPLNAPPVGLKRFYDGGAGGGEAADALEWKLQCDREGERMSLKVTTRGEGAAGRVFKEERVDLFPDQWTAIHVHRGEWREEFGVTAFLRVKPAAVRE